MDDRLESWIAAERLIAQYGPEAGSVAEERARVHGPATVELLATSAA